MSDWDSDDCYDEPLSLLKGSIDMAQIRKALGIEFEVEDATSQNEMYNKNQINSVYAYPDKYRSHSSVGEFDEDSESDSEFDPTVPFARLCKKMEDISGDGGVFKKIDQQGIGGSLPEGAYVTYNYSFYLELADEPFDTCVIRKPCKTSLNEGEMIYGLSVGIKTMRKKEKAIFIIRADYAFGSMGCPPRIPANASILAEITLLDYADFYAADTYDQMEETGKMKATFDEKLKAAKAFQRKATDSFKNDQMYAARSSYCKALWIMKTALNRDENDEKQQMEFMFRMHANLAQVHLKLHNPAKACTECQDALKLTGKFDNELKAKLYFRFGKAKMLLNSFNEAEKHMLRAQRLRPNNPDIANQLIVLYEKMDKSEELEAALCKNMFKDLKISKETKPTKSKVVKPSIPVKSAPETDPLVFDETEISGFELVDNAGIIEEEEEEEEEEVKPRMTIECFEKAVLDQLQIFCEDSSTMHISLPTGLSRDEMRVARGVATRMGLLVDTEDSGPRSHLIVYKMLKDNPLYRQQYGK